MSILLNAHLKQFEIPAPTRPADERPPVALPATHARVPARRWYPWCKVTFEFALSLTILLLASPFILLAALLVKLTSRGPVIYSQIRVGENGRTFRIYKLRTMVHNSEHATGACWAKPNDPRITRVGAFLRATHLDELPQMWNVLKGDMSLVGPRPERPEFFPNLEQAIPHYRDRLAVRPGVTGLAQVQLPADTDLNSVRRKLAYDLYYIRHMGFWLDVKLIVCTALHVVAVPYGILGRLFRLPGQARIELAYERHVSESGELPAPAIAAATA